MLDSVEERDHHDEEDDTMSLRGFATINFWADDVPAAVAWYTEFLGVESYFSPAGAGRPPGVRRVPHRRLPGRARHHRQPVPPGRRGDRARRRDHVLARRRPRGHRAAAAVAGCHRVPADHATRRLGLRHRLGGRPVRQRAGRDVQPALPRDRLVASASGPELDVLDFADAAGWESWLAAHHAGAQPRRGCGSPSAHSGIGSITITDALDVALCYGWIDGQRKGLDDVSFLQRYSRRRPKSSWSKVNVAKVEALLGGRAHAAGRPRRGRGGQGGRTVGGRVRAAAHGRGPARSRGRAGRPVPAGRRRRTSWQRRSAADRSAVEPGPADRR